MPTLLSWVKEKRYLTEIRMDRWKLPILLSGFVGKWIINPSFTYEVVKLEAKQTGILKKFRLYGVTSLFMEGTLMITK